MIVSLKRLDRKAVAQRSGAVMAGAWHPGGVLYKSFANGSPLSSNELGLQAFPSAICVPLPASLL